MSVSQWLNKPYPQIEEFNLRVAIAFTVGLVSFIFLVVFKPFGLDQVEQVSYLAGFGLNTMIAVLANYFIFPKVIPTFYTSSQWSVKKELLFFISIIILTSMLNFLYNKKIGSEIAPQYNLWSFIYMTSMVGILPILLMTYVTEIVARKRNVSEAEGIKITEHSNIDKEEIKMLTIVDESSSNNKFTFSLSQFLYASSSNNYSEIFYQEKGKVEKVIVRLSLKNLANQINEYSEIIRCHKSYLVNKRNIVDISGNARSLVISIQYISEEIPVSRSFDRNLLQ